MAERYGHGGRRPGLGYELRAPSAKLRREGLYVDGAERKAKSRYINHAEDGNLFGVV